MTIGLSEQDRALRDAVRGWAARTVPPEVVRAAVDAPADARPAFWAGLADQGLLGLHLPEEVGGAGAGLVELAVAVEELARSAVPGPYLPTVAVSAALQLAGATGHLRALADGTAIGGLALSPGTLEVTGSPGDWVVHGTSGPVMGGQIADVLLVAARGPDGPMWLRPARDRVRVEPVAGYDLLRRDAQLTADRLALDDAEVLSVAPQRLHDLCATLFAAEASGIADRCVHSASEYARVRTQFGRPIGQFQGVKHAVARMFALAEQCRVTAWDAARSLQADPDAADDSAGQAAAIAAAVAAEAAPVCAREGLQVFGAIGFTWEHDAHLDLRRAQTLRLHLGGPQPWRRRVAELALTGTRRHLAVDLPPEAAAIRRAIRAEIQPALGLDGVDRTDFLADRGYTAPHLPAPWGKDADAITQLVIDEELTAAGVRPVDMVIGEWVVPTLLAHGSTAQIDRLVPPSLRGEIVWCQFFSEPGAGSDLAALNTRAVATDGGWLLTGQKVWTTRAGEADWGICLARTDPAAPKHAGLSYFLIDVRNSAGLSIRPLRDIAGGEEFTEVFFDEVFVPDDHLVGAPGDGWRLARATLTNERVSLSTGSAIGGDGERLLAAARAVPGGVDAEQSAQLGALLADAQTVGLMGLRSTLRSLSGGAAGAEASVSKLLAAEHNQRLWRAAMDWLGPSALLGDRGPESVPHRFLSSQCSTIAGGTTNIQLNIIAERILGLPRDPAPGR